MNPTARPNQLLDGFTYVHPINDDMGNGFALSYSSVPYVGTENVRQFGDARPHDKCQFKRTDGTLCRGPRAKGTDYCIGHLRSLAKQEAADESR